MAVYSRRLNLSEKNLRIHTAGFSRNVAAISTDEESAEHSSTCRARIIDIDIDSLSDGDFSPRDTDVAARRKASLDALKIYNGSFASLCSPMDRFMASNTEHDEAWYEDRCVREDSAVGVMESWEPLEVTEMVRETRVGMSAETDELAWPGSPRPSSDTLSLSRYTESRNKRREHSTPRHRRKVRMARRRNTGERATGGRTS